MSYNDENREILTDNNDADLNESTIFTASKTVVKKRKLNNRQRGILAAAVSLFVVAAIVATILMIPKSNEEDDTDSSSQITEFSILDVETTDVKTIKVSNKKGVFTAHKKNDKADQEDIAWLISGYEKYEMPTLTYLAETVTKISAVKKFKISGDDADYGFEDPTATIDVKGYKSDAGYTLTYGSKTPDNSYMYLRINDEDTAYCVSSYDYIDKAYTAFIKNSMFDTVAPDGDDDKYFQGSTIVMVDKLVLGGTCRDEKLTVTSPPEDLQSLNFVVTSKSNYRAGNSTNLTTILNNFTVGIFSSEAAVLGYTDKDLKKYGLDKPYSTFSLDLKKYHISLSFGKPVDGMYPCIVSGSDIIYWVDETGNDWITYDGTQIYFDSLFSQFIAYVSKLSITTDKGTTDITLKRTSKQKDTSDFTAVTGDGIELDHDQMCYYYQRILQLTSQEYVKDTHTVVNQTPYMTFKITYKEGSKTVTDTIKLIKHKSKSRRYYFVLNGKGNALVDATSVEDLYVTLYSLLDGQEIGRP